MRALIRHELRQLWAIALVFLGFGLFNIYSLYDHIQLYYLGNLRILPVNYTGTFLLQFMYIYNEYNFVFLIVLLALLVSVQYKDNKSIGISHFLGSLPYTQKEISSIKILSGVCCYSIYFIVTLVGSIFLRNDVLAWNSSGSAVSIYVDYLIDGNKLSTLLIQIFILFLATTTVYLFLTMMQYQVHHFIGSAVIGLLILISPLFLIISVQNILSLVLDYTHPIFTLSSTWVDTIIGFFDASYRTMRLTDVASLRGGYLSIVGIPQFDDFWWLRSLILIGICLIILCIIIEMNKLYGLGKHERMITSPLFEKIFVLGVTICSFFVGIIFSELINFSTVPAILISIVTTIIGFMISRFICTLGKQ
ncbi:MAG: hypothetical protein ATN36_08850 [Epulopiscium sp. Nele67-Bin005]|nr:MAG: hypothetical protein ATN36_08850 [Epulopiscium sp. Nele67-Bin005]